MIEFKEAYQIVMSEIQSWGTESLQFEKSNGRILAEDILADRDFPPFDRVTKDGIAIKYSDIEKGIKSFKVNGIVAAGTVPTELKGAGECYEIMTGAVLPSGADTIVMYEEIEFKFGYAVLKEKPQLRQNIHAKGSDCAKGTILLKKGKRISAAEIGVLASVGKSTVKVSKLPKIMIISTGNELVPVQDQPLPHQIRKSNTFSLQTALQEEGIQPSMAHIVDDQKLLQEKLYNALRSNDVLLLSGGVSKGKFDFLPQTFEELGVKKRFHFVKQQPGKPFWFGKHPETGTVVFSFPGNPVSTFANYHVYFKKWLNASLLQTENETYGVLQHEIPAGGSLTRFVRVKAEIKEGTLAVTSVIQNGSGDLVSLVESDGFIRLSPEKEVYSKGDLVPFVATRKLL